jgi:hypothetical protein
MSQDPTEPKGRARGAKALAESMTPEQRKARSQKAASARWSKEGDASSPPKAVRTGKVQIGEALIDCAVLPDGTRVLSQRGVGRALGRSFGGSDWKSQEDGDDSGAGNLPFFLMAKALNPFISNELLVLVTQPRPYRHSKGGGVALGVDATALPKICDVWLKAREAVALTKPQLVVAQKAETLMRGLAHVGIVALVDEATGYQEIRDKVALQAFLQKFIRAELAAWVQRFPGEFFSELYRLRRWKPSSSSRRPGVVGLYIRDLVYERLGPGVIEELERKNPSDGRGQRKQRHHQWLSDDVGHPALSQHMYALIGFMRAEDDWPTFKHRFDRAFPKRGDTIPLF